MKNSLVLPIVATVALALCVITRVNRVTLNVKAQTGGVSLPVAIPTPAKAEAKSPVVSASIATPVVVPTKPEAIIQVKSLSIEPNRIIAGQSAMGIVVMTRAIPVPYEITLDQSFPYVKIPQRVTIPANETVATFPVDSVSTVGYQPIPPVDGKIYANYNDTVTAPLTLLSTVVPTCDGSNADYCTSAICYHCFFSEPAVPKNLIEKFTVIAMEALDKHNLMLAGDSRFVVWRITGGDDCSALNEDYRPVAEDPLANADQRLAAYATLGFSDRECKSEQSSVDYVHASVLAKETHRPSEATMLAGLSNGTFKAQYQGITIATSLVVPPTAKTMTLGLSTIPITMNMRVGTQIDRVARDWISSKFTDWDFNHSAIATSSIVPWGEGALASQIATAVPTAQINPLSGTLVARIKGLWYAPDENGVFRFNVLDDKVQYPTTHVDGDFGWIVDTHGISALVSQALEFGEQLVIGCGDAEGKAQGAFYLSQHGVSVAMAADRYEYMLLGYVGKGTIIGTAPLHKVGGEYVYGHQPVKFSLNESFIVEDTTQEYPLQYYDAGGKYFRELNKFIPKLKVTYVEVDAVNQIDKVIDAAVKADSTAIAVRITDDAENIALRAWLDVDSTHRAILFHSGLYGFAPALFEDFPDQVTFGDLHPSFN
jgi:hypothetical protein